MTVGSQPTVGPQPAEVLVIGGGNAGLPAAIFAADAGAHVTLIEKTNQLGGALWFTSHSISGAGTRLQAEKGIEDTPQSHYDDIWEIGHGKSTPEILKVATETAGAGIDWLQEIGVPFSPQTPYKIIGDRAGHATYSNARLHGPESLNGIRGSGPGRQVLVAMEREIEKRRVTGQIDVHFRTAAEELLVDASGRVTGVRTSRDGETVTFQADAVILATGGFGANLPMMREYIPDLPDAVITICPPHAQGDGVNIAKQAGAALVNMDMYVIVASGVEDPRSPGLAVYWISMGGTRPPIKAGDIWVNRRGERFVREDEPSPDAREIALMAQPGCEMFTIFDDPMRKGLHPDVTAAMALQFEGHTPNLVVSAPTIEELAVKIKVPADTLRATIDRYNAAVASGTDSEFGREIMQKAIDTAPFHAIPTSGIIFLTHGGVSITPTGQVRRADGSVFPNLFAAGEVMGAGQVMGQAFAGGQGVGAALSFGMIAGRNAATVTAPVA